MESEQEELLDKNVMNLKNTLANTITADNNNEMETSQVIKSSEETNMKTTTTSLQIDPNISDSKMVEPISEDIIDLPHNTEQSADLDNNSTDAESKHLKSMLRKPRSGIIFDDSDSDNDVTNTIEQANEPDSILNNDSEEKTILQNIQKHKRIAVFHSDSESEDMEIITPHNKSFNGDISVHNDDGSANVVYTTNSKEETDKSEQKSRWAMLCDSDSDNEVPIEQNQSSDEEVIEETQDQEKNESKAKILSKKMSRSKIKNSALKDTSNIPKKMTSKEAAMQRKEIQSESQRMLREKNVSLPYHKPRSHSLKEFLARRPKLSRAGTGVSRTSPSVAIKMSSEQLEIISKKLKEREEEVKEFYKSESESDGHSDNDYVPPADEENQHKGTISGSALPESGARNDVGIEIRNDVPNNMSNICDTDVINISPKTSLCDSHNQSNDNEITISTERKQMGDNSTPAESLMDIDDTMIQANSSENINSDSTDNPLKNTTSPSNLSSEIITENYDFNLDDENTERTDVPEKCLEKGKKCTEMEQNNVEESVKERTEDGKSIPTKFTHTDLDREIENFDNTREVIIEENTVPSPPVKSKLELLKERLANDRPRLSGGPDDVIDLESGLAKPREVVQLMERFAKHVNTKKHHSKHSVKLSVVTVESGGDIHKEEIAMNVDSDDDSMGLEEKPGAKLQKLKEELQKQMDQKKTELWQRKAAKGIRGDVENTNDIEGGEKDILDFYDEEEDEMTDEEDEEIEDDIDLTDKPRKKSAFLDEEAEVSEDDEASVLPKAGYEENLQDNEEDKEIEKNSDSDSDNMIEENDENEDSCMSNDCQPNEGLQEKKKALKRIVKPVDDSDEEDLFNDSILQKSITNAHLDSTITADEDEIPPHQPRQLQTPIRPAVSQTKSISDFLTPISFITSIQNLTSASKSVKDGPAISPFRMPIDLRSPNKGENSIPQKKLFTDSEMLSSQGSLSMSLSQSQESSSDLKLNNETVYPQDAHSESNDEPPSTQDLLGICSGQFTGVTQLDSTENATQSSDLKYLGQDDMIISQLLDEEEFEIFKKKFDSPLRIVSQHSTVDEAEEITGGGVIDSDDENEDGVQQKKKRKNQKRIQFSDDESTDEEDENNEDIDLQDVDESDEDDINNVGYDSEENEIDLKEGKQQKFKLTDFVEAEAELSESEWGSEDEDEKDLDQLEFELGDSEKFDEEKVKSDLEKIHMRRMLDDDTREVKLLQELLLEDGEMHGTGRQRQFKWKNIDVNDEHAAEKKDDDDIYLDEEESEEQWRKKRHEREMFLKKQQEKSHGMDPEEDLLCTSQLLQIGQKFLQRSVSLNSQNSTSSEKSKAESGSPFKNTFFSLQNKRGSFLNRNDQVLQRVAEYTKVSAGVNVNSKKTTKHFLFQSVSATELSIESSESKKRKASEGTPNVLKKLRLNTNLSPAVKKKLDKPERSKKLFNF